jgi:hypothetical protein
MSVTRLVICLYIYRREVSAIPLPFLLEPIDVILCSRSMYFWYCASLGKSSAVLSVVFRSERRVGKLLDCYRLILYGANGALDGKGSRRLRALCV